MGPDIPGSAAADGRDGIVPHLVYTGLFAALTGCVEGLLGKRTASERVSRAIYVFVSAMTAVVVGGWVMFLIHR